MKKTKNVGRRFCFIAVQCRNRCHEKGNGCRCEVIALAADKKKGNTNDIKKKNTLRDDTLYRSLGMQQSSVRHSQLVLAVLI